jgi:hypothetical protein
MTEAGETPSISQKRQTAGGVGRSHKPEAQPKERW